MSRRKVSILLLSTMSVVLGLISGQFVSALTTSAALTPENASTPTSGNSTTVQPLPTLRNKVDCSQYNSCGECIENWQCYYCYQDHACRLYPARDILPLHECPLAEARWLISCTFTFLAIVLIAAVILGVLLLGLCCCCFRCCCHWRCCKRSDRSGYSRLTGRDSGSLGDGPDIQMNHGNRRRFAPRAARTNRTTRM